MAEKIFNSETKAKKKWKWTQVYRFVREYIDLSDSLHRYDFGSKYKNMKIIDLLVVESVHIKLHRNMILLHIKRCVMTSCKERIKNQKENKHIYNENKKEFRQMKHLPQD